MGTLQTSEVEPLERQEKPVRAVPQEARQALLAEFLSPNQIERNEPLKPSETQSFPHLKEVLVVGGLSLAALAGRRFYIASSEISTFVRRNSSHFLPAEADILKGINWRAEAKLPNLVDMRNPQSHTMVIGKVGDLDRHVLQNGQFMMRSPDHAYNTFSKAQNLASIQRWMQRGGNILDISPSDAPLGFLHGERAFISHLSRKYPGQYTLMKP